MVDSAVFAQGPGTSEAALQFDLKILRARLLNYAHHATSRLNAGGWKCHVSSKSREVQGTIRRQSDDQSTEHV